MTVEQTQQIIDMVQAGIAKMAETMGVAVPHLWGILIKQQYVEAAQSMLFFIVTLIMTIVYYRLAKKYLKQQYRDDFGLTVVGAFVFLCLVFGLFELGSAMGHLINPEYYALKDIAEFVQGSH